MANPQEFELIDDPEIMAIQQAMQLLMCACMDSTISRQALQSACLQIGADVMTLLERKVRQSRALEKQNAILKEQLQKQTTAVTNLSAEVAQLKEDMNDVPETLPTNASRSSG